jgi:hypothetical protein
MHASIACLFLYEDCVRQWVSLRNAMKALANLKQSKPQGRRGGAHTLHWSQLKEGSTAGNLKAVVALAS